MTPTSRTARLLPVIALALLLAGCPKKFSQADTSTPLGGGSAPTAVLYAVSLGITGQRILLSGVASSDPEGAPLQYNWAVEGPGGQTVQMSQEGVFQASFIASEVGQYKARLIVSDGVLESPPATKTVEIYAASADVVDMNLYLPPPQLGRVSMYRDGDGIWMDVVAGTVTADQIAYALVVSKRFGEDRIENQDILRQAPDLGLYLQEAIFVGNENGSGEMPRSIPMLGGAMMLPRGLKLGEVVSVQGLLRLSPGVGQLAAGDYGFTRKVTLESRGPCPLTTGLSFTDCVRLLEVWEGDVHWEQMRTWYAAGIGLVREEPISSGSVFDDSGDNSKDTLSVSELVYAEVGLQRHGTTPPVTLVLPQRVISISDQSASDWDGVAPLYLDQQGDARTGGTESDLKALTIARDGGKLCFLLTFYSGSLEKNRELGIHLSSHATYPGSGDLQSPRLDLSLSRDDSTGAYQHNSWFNGEMLGANYQVGADFVEWCVESENLHQFFADGVYAGVGVRVRPSGQGPAPADDADIDHFQVGTRLLWE